jgi:hypothetical protein
MQPAINRCAMVYYFPELPATRGRFDERRGKQSECAADGRGLVESRGSVAAYLTRTKSAIGRPLSSIVKK